MDARDDSAFARTLRRASHWPATEPHIHRTSWTPERRSRWRRDGLAVADSWSRWTWVPQEAAANAENASTFW